MKLLFIANTSWYLYNFRFNLIRTLVEHGHEVVILAPRDSYSDRLGCRFVDLHLSRAGMNPVTEFLSFVQLYSKIKKLRPDFVLNFTPKINIYSSFAARLLGIPFINNIAGLGTIFIKRGILSRFVTGLYRISQKRASRIFFQNEEDMGFFLSNSIIEHTKAYRIPGSGVDLKRFVPGHSLPDSPFVFLMVARLIREKGVYEYVESARVIRNEYPHVRCLLGGFVEGEHSSGIKIEELQQWNNESRIEYIGKIDDIIEFLKQAKCVVLPSYYREGIPRILLEAAAMAIPIITTDSIGCRETVEHGKNGFLCKPQDPEDLTGKMRMILSMDKNQLKEMGLYGRKKMEESYDEKFVINAYFDAIEKNVNRLSNE